MNDAVIVDAVRTPIGKRAGALSGLHPVDLSAHVLEALARRTRLDPGAVDDVLWGCVTQIGEQAGGVGRYAVLAAGWPDSIPGVTVDRACGSSQQALHFAAAGVIAGHYDIAIAGGVESMSRVPIGSARDAVQFGRPFGPRVWERYGRERFDQGLGAEMIAERYGLDRVELDRHAVESHEKASRAIREGRFEGQIAPVETVAADGSTVIVDTDEGVRAGSTVASLSRLRPAFRSDGVVTAASSSQISDGAAALLVTSSETAARHGWSPLVRVHSVALAGVDPVTMATGPVPATAKVLRRAGLSIDEIGAFEINEAFAPVTLSWLRETGADPGVLNPLGGAMALGHPLGASGARLATTLAHHMRDNGIRYGLQAMCEAGGMANATVLELL